MVALALLSSANAPAQANLPDFPVVRTIAGSGQSGIKDGPALKAEFIMPAGAAYDRNGNLFIADRAAQRIRELSRNGIVSTVAGSGDVIAFGLGVLGGFRDGPAATAQFNYPNAVAVGPDNAIYVADTLNHVIRRIQNGVVTTFAGVPEKSGTTDGPRSQMLFTYPRSIAFDHRSNLYVADFPNGIRRIDTDGTGTTINFGNSSLFSTSSIAVVEDGDTYLLAGSNYQVVLCNVTQQKIVRAYFIQRSMSVEPQNEGAENAGPPSALAAFNLDEWLLSDALDSTVELHQGVEDYVRVLNEQPFRDAPRTGGGFRDGPGRQALFSEPTGIAVAPDGKSITVVDTGNRRIRVLSPFDRRSGALECCTPERRAAMLPKSPNSGEYRIALVGSSYVWWDSPWSESIPGLLEKQLNQNPELKNLHLTARVYPIRITGVGDWNIMDYIETVLTTGVVNAVVAGMDTDPGKVNSSDGAYDANGVDARFDERFVSKIGEVNKQLKDVGTYFFLAPFVESNYFPNERVFYRLPSDSNSPGRSDLLMPNLNAAKGNIDLLLNAVSASHVPYANIAQAFLTGEASARAHPLFMTLDNHFTPAGNALFAKVLAEKIESEHPWRSLKP